MHVISTKVENYKCNQIWQYWEEMSAAGHGDCISMQQAPENSSAPVEPNQYQARGRGTNQNLPFTMQSKLCIGTGIETLLRKLWLCHDLFQV